MDRAIFFVELFLAVWSLLNAVAAGAEPQTEREWVTHLAPAIEADSQPYRLPNGREVDLLTNCYAIECDRAPKFAEAIGQSLYYAHATGRQPGILILVENDRDYRHVCDMLLAIQLQRIRVWIYDIPRKRWQHGLRPACCTPKPITLAAPETYRPALQPNQTD